MSSLRFPMLFAAVALVVCLALLGAGGVVYVRAFYVRRAAVVLGGCLGKSISTPQMLTPPPLRWTRLVSRLFAHGAVSESVATRVYFDAGPEEVWQRILLYEEVPGRVPSLCGHCYPAQCGRKATRPGSANRFDARIGRES